MENRSTERVSRLLSVLFIFGMLLLLGCSGSGPVHVVIGEDDITIHDGVRSATIPLDDVRIEGLENLPIPTATPAPPTPIPPTPTPPTPGVWNTSESAYGSEGNSAHPLTGGVQYIVYMFSDTPNDETRLGVECSHSSVFTEDNRVAAYVAWDGFIVTHTFFDQQRELDMLAKFDDDSTMVMTAQVVRSPSLTGGYIVVSQINAEYQAAFLDELSTSDQVLVRLYSASSDSYFRSSNHEQAIWKDLSGYSDVLGQHPECLVGTPTQ